jgi:hypothetical protein
MGVWRPDKEEALKVAAWFDHDQPLQRRVIYLKFLWDGRPHLIKQLDLYHRAERGENTLHFFSVAEDGFHYKIRVDSKRLLWTLEGIYEAE